MSEPARRAWKRKFGERQIAIGAHESVPFHPGHTLGEGGFGLVVETKIDGIPIAWKRTFTRRLTERYRNEVRILGQMSEDRHEHVVNLIGSYVHRQRIGWELGILMWPIAECDLLVFLHDIDVASTWMEDAVSERMDDDLNSLARLNRITGLALNLEEIDRPTIHWLHDAAIHRLFRSIGCIAEAVRYLHDHGIRHKDLKPNQILMSFDGLWITDFDWSRDVSEMTNSATSGGDRITARYNAPERAGMKPCGRSEDIFALGCTYLEMSFRIYSQKANSVLNPQKTTDWSFQANLGSMETWLTHLKGPESNSRVLLGSVIKRMMAYEPINRPHIGEVLQILSTPAPLNYGNFFGPCCRSAEKNSSLVLPPTHKIDSRDSQDHDEGDSKLDSTNRSDNDLEGKHRQNNVAMSPELSAHLPVNDVTNTQQRSIAHNIFGSRQVDSGGFTSYKDLAEVEAVRERDKNSGEDWNEDWDDFGANYSDRRKRFGLDDHDTADTRSETQSSHQIDDHLDLSHGNERADFDIISTHDLDEDVHPLLMEDCLSPMLEQLAKQEATTTIIMCTCGGEDMDEKEIVMCEECHTWQHLSCYYDIEPDLLDDLEHRCFGCAPDAWPFSLPTALPQELLSLTCDIEHCNATFDGLHKASLLSMHKKHTHGLIPPSVWEPAACTIEGCQIVFGDLFSRGNEAALERHMKFDHAVGGNLA